MITFVLELAATRTYTTRDERAANLFALHFKGKLEKTPKGNFIVTI